MNRERIGLGIAVLVLFAGCRSGSESQRASYETMTENLNRNAAIAAKENVVGLELLHKGNWSGAEAAFKRALDADVTYGPAHNNLGKIYLKQGNLYLSAWEFQYAAKLLPRQPEPKNNLGLVLETAGKLDDAVTNYDAAISLEQDNPAYIGNAARARLRRGDRDETVRQLLQDLVLKDTRREWIDWAKTRLAMLPRSPATHSISETR